MNKFCSNCGNEVNQEANYCTNCGQKFDEEKEKKEQEEKEKKEQEEKEKKEQEEKEKKEQEEKKKKEQEEKEKKEQEETKQKYNKIPLDIKYFLIGAAILISILGIIIFPVCNNNSGSQNNESDSVKNIFKKDKNAPIPTPTPTPEPVFIFDLREMLDLAKSNKLAAENEYIGKLAKIEGKINYISEDGDYKFTVIPLFSDMFQMSGAKCEISSKEKFLSLRMEENITIIGRVGKISSFLTTDYVIDDCKIFDESMQINSSQSDETNEVNSNNLFYSASQIESLYLDRNDYPSGWTQKMENGKSKATFVELMSAKTIEIKLEVFDDAEQKYDTILQETEDTINNRGISGDKIENISGYEMFIWRSFAPGFGVENWQVIGKYGNLIMTLDHKGSAYFTEKSIAVSISKKQIDKITSTNPKGSSLDLNNEKMIETVSDIKTKESKPLIKSESIQSTPDNGRNVENYDSLINEIVYTGQDSSLYTINMDGSNMRRITKLPGENLYPSWSYDGEKIVYIYNPPTGSPFDRGIWLVRSDGKLTAKEIFNCGENSCGSVHISPDNKKIVFSDFNHGIYTINIDGTQKKKIAEGRNPVFSPNGKEIAYNFTARHGFGGSDEYIYVMNSDGTQKRQITFQGGAFFGDWAPNGNELVFSYVINWGDGNSRRAGSADSEIGIINKDGSNFRLISNKDNWRSESPSFSYDGEMIIFQSSDFSTDGPRELYIMNKDGSKIKPINNSVQGKDPSVNKSKKKNIFGSFLDIFSSNTTPTPFPERNPSPLPIITPTPTPTATPAPTTTPDLSNIPLIPDITINSEEIINEFNIDRISTFEKYQNKVIKFEYSTVNSMFISDQTKNKFIEFGSGKSTDRLNFRCPIIEITEELKDVIISNKALTITGKLNEINEITGFLNPCKIYVPPKILPTPTPIPTWIDAKTIIDQFNENSNYYSQFYENKYLEIFGTVFDTGTNIRGLPYLELGSNRVVERIKIKCDTVSKSNTSYKDGSENLVSGNFKKFQGTRIILDECEVNSK